MNTFLYSDQLEQKKEKKVSLASWKVHSFFQAYKNEFPGGDKFGISLNKENALCFYIADATGHGTHGAKFWKAHGAFFDDIWKEALSTSFLKDDIKKIAAQFNSKLIQAKEDFSSQICMAIGILSSETLRFANFGYGTHLLVKQNGVAWQKKPEELFGLKLGWMDTKMWDNLPRAFVYNEVTNVDRLILMTDSFLADDHQNPHETMQSVADMNKNSIGLAFNDVLPYFLQNFEHAFDDTSLVVIEKE